MAYGGAVGGSSIYKGSEEGFDYECDPCKVDEAIREANHFCPLCQEYLCDTCHAHHRRSKATRSHKIQSVEDVVQKKSGPVRVMGPQNTCGCGQNIADFYCEAHKEVFCGTCKTVRHKSCNVEDVYVVAKRKGTLPQFKATIDELNELRQQASETESLQDNILESLAANEDNCIESINTFREDINKLLDELERNTVIDVRGRCTRQKDIINDRKEVCRNIRDKLDADYKTATDANDPRDIFIQDLRLSQTLRAYRDAINDAKSETTHKVMTFEKESTLVNVQRHVTQLGHVKECSQNHLSQNSFLNSNVIQLGVFPLQKTANGMCLVNGNVIVSQDNALTLLDSNFRITNTIKLAKCPGNITAISVSEVLCSLPSSKQLQYVDVFPNLKQKNYIDLNNHCYGIKYFKGQIFACCCNGNTTEIQVLTKDGVIKRSIFVKGYENEVISKYGIKPTCIDINNDGSRLYISEYARRTLKCITTNGETIFRYIDVDLQRPRGIIVDDNDNCLVCDQFSGLLKVLRADGSFYRDLCKVKNPLWLSWRKTDNTLIVCNGSQLITYTMQFD